jgi:hypothetical protein
VGCYGITSGNGSRRAPHSHWVQSCFQRYPRLVFFRRASLLRPLASFLISFVHTSSLLNDDNDPSFCMHNTVFKLGWLNLLLASFLFRMVPSASALWEDHFVFQFRFGSAHAGHVFGPFSDWTSSTKEEQVALVQCHLFRHIGSHSTLRAWHGI